MPKFFIDRPIFAWVLSLLIMLGGVLAVTHLPVAQYPTVAPPSIAINATYAGASAETVQDTVRLLQKSEYPLILGLMTVAAVVAAPLSDRSVTC